MGLFYKLSNISFIGGSLIKDIGGHNPFEALKLDSVVITENILLILMKYIKN